MTLFPVNFCNNKLYLQIAKLIDFLFISVLINCTFKLPNGFISCPFLYHRASGNSAEYASYTASRMNVSPSCVLMSGLVSTIDGFSFSEKERAMSQSTW